MLMKNRGFTLIELMITVAVGAILLSWAIPSFQDVIRQNRITTATNEVIGAINIARSEAIKRGSDVTITADGGDWGAGWSITGTDPTSGSAVTLKVGQAVTGTISLSGGPGSITFTASGLPSSSDVSSTITVCDSSATGKRGRQVGISATGRPRVASDYDYTCS